MYLIIHSMNGVRAFTKKCVFDCVSFGHFWPVQTNVLYMHIIVLMDQDFLQGNWEIKIIWDVKQRRRRWSWRRCEKCLLLIYSTSVENSCDSLYNDQWFVWNHMFLNPQVFILKQDLKWGSCASFTRYTMKPNTWSLSAGYLMSQNGNPNLNVLLNMV